VPDTRYPVLDTRCPVLGARYSVPGIWYLVPGIPYLASLIRYGSSAVPTNPPLIEYRSGTDLDLDEVIELYRASTLGERRPVDDRDCMARMVREADLLISAWQGRLLVGIARTLTDHCYVAYLADLAVRASHQRRGIGTELVRLTREALGPRAFIVLLSAPAAVEYYPRIGFRRHSQAWVLEPGQELGR
jgi:ribosomal protein S18 acetylase RimI-like enzyme